ncbi:eCIS core domain-containing protein [Zavarzinella formosa]|uniref:eCIS core domain-containing protein n=1 Tax=Zavarzinella formosa TaxID=360055 RepID=UPI00037E3888|nr:DUF4157 domain-containing protein [Zavarzinella formosa]
MANLFRLARTSAAPPPSTNLTISSPTDPAELEAERIAAQVMRMSAPTSTPIVQRKCAACDEEEKVRRSATGESPGTAPPIVNQVLGQPGQPLSESTRNFFEPRLGADLSAVRVHTDSQAGRSADAVQAKAYTVGNSIAFANGQYAPQSEIGKGLLAHELVHVVQQGSKIRRETDAPAGMTSGTAPESVVAPPTTDSGPPEPVAHHDPSDEQTLQKIAAIVHGNIWVGPIQELELENHWKTFQGRLTGLLRKDANVTRLFIESVDRGAEIEYLGDVDAIRKRFLGDVTETAKKHMDANDSLIASEIDRLGLKQLGPVFTDTQRGGIDEIQKAAPEFKRAETYKAQILSIPVGYEYETISDGLGHITIKNEVAFNPTKPPAIPYTDAETPPRPTWQQTNTQYLKAESALSGLKIKYPALAALQTAGSVDAAIGTDPMAARAAILKAFETVQGNIVRTRERIATRDLDPLNLQPIHAQLFSGQKSQSMTAWNGQYDQWLAKELLSHHESVEFWKAMGIGTAAAAAFIIAEFATAGWATVFVASGVALSGLQAADSWEKYLAVADASKTALNDKQNLVGSGRASDALVAALLDSVFFFLDAYSAAAKGVKGAATALERGGVKAGGKEAAEEETKRLIEKEGREATKREAERIAEQTARAAGNEGAEDGRELLAAEITAEAKSATSHTIQVSKQGVIRRCSSPCSILAKRFEHVLEELPSEVTNYLEELERRSVELANLGEKASGKESQALANEIAEFERELSEYERKLDIHDIFEEGQGDVSERLPPRTDSGFNPTAASTKVFRKMPGTASGGGKWPVIRDANDWLSNGRIIQFPGQVAEKLRDLPFVNFDHFRMEFWKAVEKDPVLRSPWSALPEDIANMKSGKPPFVQSNLLSPNYRRSGPRSNRVYQIDHGDPLKITGAEKVYDMDNMMIVTAEVNQSL